MSNLKKDNNYALKIHNSNIPEMIRKTDIQREKYSDEKFIRLEDKVTAFSNFILKNCSVEKSKKIYSLISNICSYYKFRYPEHEIDNILANKIKNPHLDYGFVSIQSLLNALPKDELRLLLPEKKDEYIINSDKIYMDFTLTEDGVIKANEINLRLEKGVGFEEKSVLEDYDGLTIEQAIMLLNKSKLTAAEKILIEIKNDYIYNTEILKNLFNGIMYYIMYSSKTVESAKKALLLASDFNNSFSLDIEIPLLYGISYNDKKAFSLIKFYENMGGRLNALCIPNYFENANKSDKKIAKESYPIHTFIQKYNKILRKKKTK